MRVPTLRRQPNGYWFCRWGGRDHYFGTRDKTDAMPKYLACLAKWQEWRNHRLNRRRIPPADIPSVAQLAQKYLRVKQLETGMDNREYLAKHLARFTWIYGDFRTDIVRVKHLQCLKEHMLQRRFAPKTINHDLIAVRGMFRWAVGLELIEPVSFEGCRNMPLGPPPDKSMTEAEVKRLVKEAPTHMSPWLAVTYLALLRPSETVRCAHGEGKWTATGIYRLRKGKMDMRTSLPRHCVFSDSALTWLKKCKPVWSRLDSFSQAVRAEFGNGWGPGRLRHSAACHLAQRGVAVSDIELLLGHAPPRLQVTYHRPAWQRLRGLVDQIAQVVGV